MEAIKTPWSSWCRLCGTENTENAVNIHSKSNGHQLPASGAAKLTLKEALEKYFWVHSTLRDMLPKVLCWNCNTLISSIMQFDERVERTQKMYRFLVENFKQATNDLPAVRERFQIYDDNIPLLPGSTQDVTISNAQDDISEEDRNEPDITAQDWSIDSEYDEYENGDDDDEKKSLCEEDEEEYLSNNSNEEEQPYDTISEDSIWGDDDEEPSPKRTKPDSIKNKSRTGGSNKVPKKKDKKRFAEDFVFDVPCSKCEVKFELYSAYCEHMELVHNDGNLEKRCPLCDRNLHTWYHLGRHMRTHMPLESRYPIKCPECDSRFSTSDLLEAHINHRHKNEKPYICEICGFCGATKHSLSQHMYVHTDNAPFECQVCKKRFKKKTRLNFHMDIHAPNKFVCTICGLQLNTRATLKNHFLVHTDQKQHKCDVCDATFKRSKALKAHLILHAGLKPYVCDFCGISYSSRSVCRAHMKKEHPEDLASMEAERGKAYTKDVPTLEMLKEVTKTAKIIRTGRSSENAVLPCNYCDSKFSYTSSRKAHIKQKHPEEFAMLESSVDKTDGRKSDGTRKRKALISETKDKPYSEPVTCQYCGRTFGYRKLWQNHMKRIHRDKWAALQATKQASNAKMDKSLDTMHDISLSPTVERPMSTSDSPEDAPTSSSTNIQDLFVLLD